MFKVSRLLRDRHTFAIFHPHLNQCQVKRVNNENMILLSAHHSEEEEAIYRRISKVLRSKEGDHIVLFTNDSSGSGGHGGRAHHSKKHVGNDSKTMKRMMRNDDKDSDSGGTKLLLLPREIPITHQTFQIVQVNRSACLLKPVHDTTLLQNDTTAAAGHSLSPSSPYHITMCTGMLSKRESWEEQLYACAQVGIHHIQPILPPQPGGEEHKATPFHLSSYSADVQAMYRYYTNQERITKVVISACEQAKQLQRFPIISQPRTIAQLMTEMRRSQREHTAPLFHKKYYLDVNGQHNLLDILNELKNGEKKKSIHPWSRTSDDDDSDTDSDEDDNDDSSSSDDDSDEEDEDAADTTTGALVRPRTQQEQQKRIMFMLGPEADWTTREKVELLDNNFESVSISNKVVFRSQDCTQIVVGSLATIL